MTAAELIAALSALPSDTEVIMPDLLELEGKTSEHYAKAVSVEVRHVSTFELGLTEHDFTPTVEPFEGSAPVALIIPAGFDWPGLVLKSGNIASGHATYGTVITIKDGTIGLRGNGLPTTKLR